MTNSKKAPVQGWEKIECTFCNGDGFTAEHSGDISCDDGEHMNCPLQVQCNDCHGEGVYMTLDTVRQTLAAERKRWVEEIRGMKKEYKHHFNVEGYVNCLFCGKKIKNNKPNCEPNSEYNRAIRDILSKLERGGE